MDESDVEPPGYDRDETVEAMTSFYQFLGQTHLPDSAVKIPPEGGWPELTDEYLSFMGKTSTVNDLIRHMPFVRQDSVDDPFHIYYRTVAVDFTGEVIRAQPAYHAADPLPDVFEANVPPHVLTLAFPVRSAREGYAMLLDTERGTVTLCDFQYGTEQTELSEYDQEPEDDWREQATYGIVEFFQKLKDEFLSFKMVAINQRHVDFGGMHEDEMEEIKQTYREHGWLTENYRKEECMQKVEEVVDRARHRHSS